MPLKPKEGLADPAAMTAHEIHLQLLEFVGRNVHIGEFSEAGANAVDDRATCDNLFHDAARGADRRKRRVRNFNWFARNCDTGDLLER